MLVARVRMLIHFGRCYCSDTDLPISAYWTKWPDLMTAQEIWSIWPRKSSNIYLRSIYIARGCEVAQSGDCIHCFSRPLKHSCTAYVHNNRVLYDHVSLTASLPQYPERPHKSILERPLHSEQDGHRLRLTSSPCPANTIDSRCRPIVWHRIFRIGIPHRHRIRLDPSYTPCEHAVSKSTKLSTHDRASGWRHSWRLLLSRTRLGNYWNGRFSS